MIDEALETTRVALHAVAELVLAGPQHRLSGSIQLRVNPTGFRTRDTPTIAVDGTDLFVAGARYPISGRTARELGHLAGVEAGAPRDLYGDGSGIALDERLTIDVDHAAMIEQALAAGNTALRTLDRETDPILWPEHFDVAIRLDEVNYGVSAGDGHLPVPYAYVAPATSPSDHAFWNAPFGASRPISQDGDADQIHRFFLEGRRRLSLDSR